MFVANVLEILVRVAKLQCSENEVDVDPVMRLLIEWGLRERIADVEDVAVDILLRPC